MDIIDNGLTLVYYAPSIADKEAPTIAEVVTAGLRLSQLITADGLVGFEPDTGDVDNSALESRFGTRLPGRPNFSGTLLRLKKQDNDEDPDEAYETLQYGTRGFIVIRRYILASIDLALDDEVEVHPIACGETRRLPADTSGDSVARYEVPVKIHDQPELRAVISEEPA